MNKKKSNLKGTISLFLMLGVGIYLALGVNDNYFLKSGWDESTINPSMPYAPILFTSDGLSEACAPH